MGITLKEIGRLKSAHQFAGGALFGDLAYDLKRADALDFTKENMERKEIKDSLQRKVIEDINEAKEIDNLEDIAEKCGEEKDTIDDTVRCMVDDGVPAYAATGLGETATELSKEDLKAAGSLEF